MNVFQKILLATLCSSALASGSSVSAVAATSANTLADGRTHLVGANLAKPLAPAAPDVEPAACCSKTYNDSPYSVLTYKHWTCDWGTTGSSSTGCTDLNGGSRWLDPGEDSPLFQDWDVLRVDAGWCYKVKLIVPGKTWRLYYNQTGLGHRYVKIEDWGTAVVEDQRYGSCP